MKMKRFIFGFQRRVWCPKCTPASSRSFMVISDTAFPPPGVCSTVRSPVLGNPSLVGGRVRWTASAALPLAELEPFAGARLPVLLPLLHARVAGQEAFATEQRPQALVLARERPGDRHAER